ncbi:MAG: TRAP transporter permease [Sulfurospirillaceae bacterium]|nr:TRAP transporter permease [Sulfurospirillaceae bacterium]
MKKQVDREKEYLEDVQENSKEAFETLSELDKSTIPSENHMTAEEKLISELEGQRVFEKGTSHYWLITIIAFCWSVFQLYVVISPINSVYLRSIHLAFAVALAFTMYPILKKPSLRNTITWYDMLFAAIGIGAVLYKWYEYTALAMRSGAWVTTDVVVGVIVVVIVLEAARRVMGLPLPVIAIIFLLYDYFGPYMPDLIAHKGASVSKLMGQMVLTTEGIYGVPLGVSASYVFLFVLFGSLLDRAGAGEYFIKLAYTLLGRFDGGPAKASVAASGLMGMISGSSIANTVTVGTFTIPLMKRLGFPPAKAAAVEVSASVNGQLMPPIMGAAAFIIAEFLGLSYTEVVFAAFLPAFVCYFSLFYIVHLEAKKQGIHGEDPKKLGRAWPIFIKGIHYIIPIFFLMYTLIILRHSAQSAAFNAIMFMMIIMITQKPIKAFIKKEKITLGLLTEGFSDIGHGMINGAKGMVPIAVATGVAGLIVGSVTLTGIGLILADVIDQLSHGYIILVLLFTAITSLILGMGLPTTANYIVMASLTAPVIMQLAASNGYVIPMLAAHMFVFYFGILADDTPPVGLAAYAAAGIAKADPIKAGLQGFFYDIRTGLLPFMFFFNNKLLMISSVDPTDPNDPSKWVWISNPVEIGAIFLAAITGMFAFTSATQGWFLTKVSTIERLMLICVIPFTMQPQLMIDHLDFPNEYVSYLTGAGIYFLVYLIQKAKVRKNPALA